MAVFRDKKKVSKVVFAILFTFVYFCSLKIDVKATDGNIYNFGTIENDIPWYSKYAYKFFMDNGVSNIDNYLYDQVDQTYNQETYTGSDGNTYYIFNRTDVYSILGQSVIYGSWNGSNNGLRWHSASKYMYVVFASVNNFGSQAMYITGSNNTYTTDYSFQKFGNMKIYSYRFRATNDSPVSEDVYLQFSSGNIRCRPIWMGMCDFMPTEVRDLVGYRPDVTSLNSIDTKLSATNNALSNIYSRQNTTNQNLLNINSSITTTNNHLSAINTLITDIKNYLSTGNNSTSSKVSSNDTVTNLLSTNSNNLATFESNQSNSLDTNLRALDSNFSNNGLISNNKFISSAIWVNYRFNELILNTPFELVLVFCLSLGIALAMLGKVKY